MDPLKLWDQRRRACPVSERAQDDGARVEGGSWDVRGHPETLTVLRDHQTFSNEVSAHLPVPNGMDPPRHGPYRAIVERYFAPDRMAAFEPGCREIAVELVDTLVERAAGAAGARSPDGGVAGPNCGTRARSHARRGTRRATTERLCERPHSRALAFRLWDSVARRWPSEPTL